MQGDRKAASCPRLHRHPTKTQPLETVVHWTLEQVHNLHSFQALLLFPSKSLRALLWEKKSCRFIKFLAFPFPWSAVITGISKSLWKSHSALLLHCRRTFWDIDTFLLIGMMVNTLIMLYKYHNENSSFHRCYQQEITL